MLSRYEILNIVKSALKLRADHNVGLDSSFCIIDMVEKLGLEVRFVDISSMEGAFFKDSKIILLSTLRPEGRIRYTCAHELGHYIYNHGDHFEELVENISDGTNKKKESISDTFAAFLLMPETTVRSGFLARHWDHNNPSAEQVYTVSCWLGVGYATLLKHMRFGLKFLSDHVYKRLIKIQPKQIKAGISGIDITTNFIIIDEFWKGRPVDVSVGDYIRITENFEIDSDKIKKLSNSSEKLFLVQKPGMCHVKNSDPTLSKIMRIRKNQYIGRSIFRHLDGD